MAFLKRLLPLLFLTLLAAPAYATSSINTALPAQGLPYSSSVIRGNFGAAANDIDGLQTLNVGASAPVTCNLANIGTAWLNNSTTPYTLSYCDGTGTWIAQDYWDVTNHIVTPPTGRGECQSITAATTTDLGSVPQSCIMVTGNSAVSITSFGSSAKAGDVKFVVFSGSNTIVYNATSLILPSAENLSAAAGTVLIAEALGNSDWQVFVAQGSGGGSTVTSFNGRTGAVVPASNDYNFSQLAGTIAYSQLVSPLQSGTANYIPYWASSSSLANGSPTTIAQTVLPAIAPPGTGTNVSCSEASASASITCTADAFVVCAALTSTNCAEIGSVNQTFNGGTTGAGGMDTGSLPSSGFVGIYVIFDQTAQSVALLGFNCSSVCPTIYSGAHMPSGYTMSALLTALPTNSTPQIVGDLYVKGKRVSFPLVTVLTTSTSHASATSLSISGFVPPNAVSISGSLNSTCGTTPGNTAVEVVVFSDSATSGQQTSAVSCASVSGAIIVSVFIDLSIPTSQTMWYENTVSGTSPTSVIDINTYTIP